MTTRLRIQDFENYEVDAAGRVYSKARGTWRERRTTVNKNGYAMLTITRGLETSSLYVHRLVAEAFVPGYSPSLWVNHKNGDKLDNRAENLEWTTPGENNAHKYRVLKQPHPMSGVRGAACKYSTPVQGFNLKGELVVEFAAMKEADRAGYKAGAISRCVKSGKIHRGLRWRLANQTTTPSSGDEPASVQPGCMQP